MSKSAGMYVRRFINKFMKGVLADLESKKPDSWHGDKSVSSLLQDM